MQCSKPFIRIEIDDVSRRRLPSTVKLNNGAFIAPATNSNFDFVKHVLGKRYFDSIVLIPCGKCMSCRINQAEEWSLRCALEFKYSTSARFITLTYSDDHLPLGYRFNYKQRSVTLEGSLRKRDLQLFNKRLRDYFSRHYGISNIRFFACGEYGPLTSRPHYHGIYFNLPEFEHEYIFKNYTLNGQKFSLSWSPELEKLWSHGFVSIGACSWQSISYVARYTTKKFRSSSLQIDDSLWHDSLVPFLDSPEIEDDFLLMSRNPGIGRSFFDLNSDSIYSNDFLIENLPGFGMKQFKPPRYFDRLYDDLNPDHYESIKLLRKERSDTLSNISSSFTDLSREESFLINERIAKDKVSHLPRII